MSSPSSPERQYWFAWSKISRVGPVLLQRFQQHFGSLERAWHALPLELAQVEGVGTYVLDAIEQGRSKLKPDRLLAEHEEQNPHFWTPADSDYPRLLLEIPNYPLVLYYQGEVKSWENQGIAPSIGIVGTRDPSEYGRRWTKRITHALVDQGFTIVSGLADGIDAEAHRACVDRGGRTIAVLGTGVDVVYPHRNRDLYQHILQTGLVMSEYPQGTPPDRVHFPQRNRIVAGLCRAVLVMEAPKKSGALITAHIANEYNREVYILPGSLDNPRSRGCLELLSQGAQAILDEDNLLELLGAIPALDVPSSTPPDLDPDLAKVLEVLNFEPISLDRIVQDTQLPMPIVSSALLQLELMALVSQVPGMRYQRC
ncbi:MAG: DNA-processing protein DprA [Prochlorotrichaceae cyanobacterium]